MKYYVSIGLLLSCLSLQSQNPNPSTSVDAYIQNEMDLEHFPGVSAVIVKNGEIVWVESYGFADIENNIPVEDSTIFMLASISKLFAGTATMQLMEDGLLELDDAASDYLPWLFYHPLHGTVPITLRQIMTHTSSIQDNGAAMGTYYDYPDPSISLADCMEGYFSYNGTNYSATDNFLSDVPGTVYDYSNMATALNGYVTERITSTPFDTYCKTNIFEPLCMENTAWFMADLDSNQVARPYSFSGGNYVANAHYGFADYPDGQLRSSVLDLANFMITYLNGGSLGTNTILSSSSVNEMWTPQVPAIEGSQGLNWYQELLYHSGGATLLWGHNGGELGVSTDMYLDPATNIGLCVLANGGGSAIYICDKLYDYALSLNPTNSIVPECGSIGISELSAGGKELVKILDVLGRETTFKSNTTLIYLYSDGSSEKVYVIE